MEFVSSRNEKCLGAVEAHEKMGFSEMKDMSSGSELSEAKNLNAPMTWSRNPDEREKIEQTEIQYILKGFHMC